MANLHPWLSRNCLRQAYLAFDLDSPADMPERPILQVMKVGTSTVTMASQKVATVKYYALSMLSDFSRLQCIDGGMGQNTGILI